MVEIIISSYIISAVCYIFFDTRYMLWNHGMRPPWRAFTIINIGAVGVFLFALNVSSTFEDFPKVMMINGAAIGIVAIYVTVSIIVHEVRNNR